MKTKLLATIIATTFAISSYAQNVGIGTAIPNAKLDVNGAIATREGTAFSNTQLTISGGPFNDVALPSANGFFRIPSGVSNITGAFTINGFAGGNDGQELLISNQSGYTLTLTNLSTSNESPTDQILLGNGSSTLTIPNGSSFTLKYSANVANSSSTGAWLITAVQVPTTSGTITSVGASSPLSSSGGTTPNISLTGIVGVGNGGTNSGTALTANAIMVSNGTQIVQGPAGNTGQILTNTSGTPAWTTASYPATTTANQILYSNALNTVTGLITAANGVLVTNGSSVPSIGSTLPAAVQGNITTLGTITSGTWNGTTIAVGNGGTGLTTYTAGALLDASSTSTIGQIPDVLAGSYLRSVASGSAPTWSTLTLPNAATKGDLLYASATNTIGNLSDIAAGSVLLSGGTSTAPSWGSINTILGTGTANYVTRWATSTTLGTGVMEDNGTNVGIGAAPNSTDLVYIDNLAGAGSQSALHAKSTSGVDFYFGYTPSFTLASGQVCSTGIGAFCNSTAGDALVSSTTVSGGSAIIGSSTTGKGVYGINNVGSQGSLAAYPYGAVVGLAENATSGIGVIGIGNGANANANGDIPSAGSGGAFMGSTRGVFAEYTNTSGGGASIEGLTANATDITFGATTQDFGVLGLGSTTGVNAAVAGYAGTFATPAAAAGVYGSSSSSTVYAIYANNTSGTGTNGAGLYVSGTTGLQGTATLGQGSNYNGTLVYDNSNNGNTVTLQSGGTSTSYTLTLPTAAPSTSGEALVWTTGGALNWATINSSSGWALTGNGSTTPGTNFIGTTDGNAFITKTDGFEGMRVTTGGGSAPGNVVIG